LSSTWTLFSILTLPLLATPARLVKRLDPGFLPPGPWPPLRYDSSRRAPSSGPTHHRVRLDVGLLGQTGHAQTSVMARGASTPDPKTRALFDQVIDYCHEYEEYELRVTITSWKPYVHRCATAHVLARCNCADRSAARFGACTTARAWHRPYVGGVRAHGSWLAASSDDCSRARRRLRC
jgi:hypothetical protein